MNSFSKKYFSLQSDRTENNIYSSISHEILNQPDVDSFLDWWAEVYKLWLEEYPEELYHLNYDEIKVRKEFVLKLGIKK